MKKRATKTAGRQGGGDPKAAMRQVLLPMVMGMVATKQVLETWVHQHGLQALEELFRSEAERIAGPKGKHQRDRRYNHWGSTDVEVPFGGQRVSVRRPRVRSQR